MHRAGTSAVTRTVNLLGVPIAAEEHLKPGSGANPTGFWEVAPLTELNNDLLADLGADWSCPPPLGPGWIDEPEISAQRERARREVAAAHPTPQWVWKDPRNCLTLTFWLDALDVRPVLVLVHRHPLEVAGSLATRDGFPKPLGLALWERYMRDALAAADGAPLYALRYADLLADPAAAVRDLGAFLAARDVHCSPEEASEVARFLSDDLRHSSFDEEALERDSEVSASQSQLHRLLESLTGAHEAFQCPELPQPAAASSEVIAQRRLARGDLVREVRTLRRQLQAEHQDLVDTRERLRGTLEKLDSAKATMKEVKHDLSLLQGWGRFMPARWRR